MNKNKYKKALFLDVCNIKEKFVWKMSIYKNVGNCFCIQLNTDL